MYISCLLGLLLILSYCIVVSVKYKEIPNSISQIVYMLPYKWRWTFTVVMFLSAAMILPQLAIIAGEKYAILAFLTVAGIIGVGVDPLVRGEKNIIHYVSAIVMGTSSQLLAYFLNPYVFMTWIPYVIYTMYMDNGKKNMFFAEMVMLAIIGILCLYVK